MKAFIFLASVLTALPLSAKSITDTTQVFHLGEVTVFEHQRNFKVNQVNSDFMKSADIQRVSEALNWVPGLIMQEVGGRSEAGFMLRGFSSNDVPIYIDGVPLTAPYDGTVDLYRLSAGMLSKIDVSKSASPLLLGCNTMGPSINLISRQPQKPLEIHFDVNTLWHSNLNVGGRWNKWFAQLDLSYSNVGNFRLPHSYPTDSK
jgi:iron complex outermembrane receptor protein